MNSSMVSIVISALDHASPAIKAVNDNLENLSVGARAADGLKSSLGNAERGSKLLLGTTAALATGIAAGAVAIVTSGFKSRADMQQTKASLNVLTGSQEESQKILDETLKTARKGPYTFPGLAGSVQQLVAFGYTGEEANRIVLAAAESTATFGGTEADIAGIAGVFGKIGVEGKITGDTIQQLASHNIPALKIIANKMGITTEEAMKKISSGALGADEAVDILLEGIMNGSDGVNGSTAAMAGGMEALKGTFKGAAMDIKSGFRQIGEAIVSEKILERITEMAIGFKDQLNQLADVIKTYQPQIEAFFNAFLDVVQKVADGVAKIKWADIQTGVLMASGAIMIGMVPALYAMATGFAAVMIPLLPFLAAGALLGALAALIMNNWRSFMPFFRGIFDVVSPLAEAFSSTFKEAFSSLMSHVQPIWSSLKELFVSLLPILSIVGAALTVLVTVAVAVLNGVLRAIGPLINGFVQLAVMVAQVVNTIVKLLTNDMVGAQKAWEKAVEASKKVFIAVWEAIKGFFTGFVSTIVGVFSAFGVDIMSKVDEIKANLVRGFTEAFVKAVTAVTTGVKDVVTAILGKISDFREAGKGLITAFAGGITAAFGAAKTAVSTGLGFLRKLLPGSDAKEGPLSDLTKSGSALFPTFAKGILKNAGAAQSAVQSGLKGLDKELGKSQMMPLLTGGGVKTNFNLNVNIDGTIELDSNGEKVDLKVLKQQIEEQLTGGIDLNGLRQQVRRL